MTGFKDNFSKQADLYVKYRPVYPPELFVYLATLTREHELAWDCGTGNGQSAIKLAAHFKQVLATDPSEAQITNAITREGVTYKIEKAEQSSLQDASVDLITVAQAIHWFDFEKFYAETKRVLKPGGVLAAWCYALPFVSDEVDKVTKHFHNVTIDEFWQAENRMIEKEYSTLPFPLKVVGTPVFYMEKEWDFDEYLGWISTWSAIQRYIQKRGEDPVPALEVQLLNAWGDRSNKKTIRWKIILKAGRW